MTRLDWFQSKIGHMLYRHAICKCVSILRPKEENVPVCPECKSNQLNKEKQ